MRITWRRKRRSGKHSEIQMVKGIWGRASPRTAFPRIWQTYTHSNAGWIHWGHLLQNHSLLTSIFQIFRLDSRSQQKCPSASTPLNPKPAALCTASAVGLRQNVRNQAKVFKRAQTLSSSNTDAYSVVSWKMSQKSTQRIWHHYESGCLVTLVSFNLFCSLWVLAKMHSTGCPWNGQGSFKGGEGKR